MGTIKNVVLKKRQDVKTNMCLPLFWCVFCPLPGVQIYCRHGLQFDKIKDPGQMPKKGKTQMQKYK